MATFGYTSIGASQASLSSNIAACKFTCGANGTISTISVYCDNTGGAGASLGVAVYSDVAGTPTTKLAEDTGNVAIPGSGAWIDLNLSLVVTSGTVYWLAMWSDAVGNPRLFYDAGGTNQYNQDTAGETFETWPNPWNSASYFDLQVSIYATLSGGAAPMRAPSALLLGVA